MNLKSVANQFLFIEELCGFTGNQTIVIRVNSSPKNDWNYNNETL